LWVVDQHRDHRKTRNKEKNYGAKLSVQKRGGRNERCLTPSQHSDQGNPQAVELPLFEEGAYRWGKVTRRVPTDKFASDTIEKRKKPPRLSGTAGKKSQSTLKWNRKHYYPSRGIHLY